MMNVGQISFVDADFEALKMAIAKNCLEKKLFRDLPIGTKFRFVNRLKAPKKVWTRIQETEQYDPEVFCNHPVNASDEAGHFLWLDGTVGVFSFEGVLEC
jgi:hypothetical protein